MTARDSLVPLLRPRSVAVIGASNRPGTIGHAIFGNLVRQGFRGPVYPIHPTARAIQAVRAWPDIAAVPDEVDLAVIAVPPDQVLPVVQACAEKGVRAAIVITAGFREAGADGRAAEREIVRIARSAGMRLVGPNCLGVVTTDPETRLDATFAPTFPPEGTVAVASQSGALGVAMLDTARELNIGVSDFVSMGNKADVSGNDLLEWWEADPRTRVILLYLESFGNPARFARIARRVSRDKPIVAVKSGRSARGNLAASSHTGSLAGTDRAVEALVEETGLIRVDTVEELFGMAAFLAHQPVPRGNRVAIVTNAGGPGILATDAAAAWGLEVTDLPASVRAELASFLPPTASVRNPVDMIASAGPDAFERALRVLLRCDAVDAVIVLFVPPITVAAAEVGQAIARASAGADKPVLSCFMGRQGVPEALSQLQAARIPSYAFPESAVQVLARACRYGAWRSRAPGTVVTPGGFSADRVRHAVTRARVSEGGWLTPDGVADVLAAAGIPTPTGRVAASADEAVEVARTMGFPVVLKLVADGIAHKTEVGGVEVDLRDPGDVRAAYARIRDALDAHGLGDRLRGVLVQPLVHGGVETVVGLSRDPVYGPLIMFGLGGIHVELMGDVAFRLTPLTDAGARRLVRSIRGFPLLQGWRGAEPADTAAIEDVLLRVSALAEACPEVVELDLNPVVALARGCVAVDARIRVDEAGRADRGLIR